MSIGNHELENANRLKINLFTPCRVLGSKLIFFAPHGAGVNEEPKRSGARRSQNQWVFMLDSRYS